MIEQGLYTYLAADSTLGPLVTTPGGAARIYGVMLPPKAQAILPAIVYSTVSTRPIESLRGPNQLDVARWQFDCYGKTFLESKQIKEALKSALFPPDINGDPSSLSADLNDGSTISATRLILELDKPYEVGDGGYIFCAVVDVEISFTNAS